MRLHISASFLLFALTAVAQPVTLSNATEVAVSGNQGLPSNFGSSWSKRGDRRPSRRSQHIHAGRGIEKRYWKVSSVWIGKFTGFWYTICSLGADDEEASRASNMHRTTTTITVTVDAMETEYVAPTSTNLVSSTAATTTAVVTATEAAAANASHSASVTTSSVSLTPVATGSPTGKLVFAHFMVGIVSPYTIKDWEYDMTLAKSYGIDGFALNIGKDPYTDAQLALAYQAAEGLDFKVFISFDVSPPIRLGDLH